MGNQISNSFGNKYKDQALKSRLYLLETFKRNTKKKTCNNWHCFV